MEHKIKCRQTAKQTHTDTRETRSFFPAHYMSGVGLSALAEMPLGTDILRFGGGLPFL